MNILLILLILAFVWLSVFLNRSMYRGTKAMGIELSAILQSMGEMLDSAALTKVLHRSNELASECYQIEGLKRPGDIMVDKR